MSFLPLLPTEGSITTNPKQIFLNRDSREHLSQSSISRVQWQSGSSSLQSKLAGLRPHTTQPLMACYRRDKCTKALRLRSVCYSVLREKPTDHCCGFSPRTRFWSAPQVHCQGLCYDHVMTTKRAGQTGWHSLTPLA